MGHTDVAIRQIDAVGELERGAAASRKAMTAKWPVIYAKFTGVQPDFAANNVFCA
jgi:hypothetical protein